MKLIQKIKLKVKKTFHNDPNKQCSNVTTSPLSWRGAGGEASYSFAISSAGFTFIALRICLKTMTNVTAATMRMPIRREMIALG